MIKESEIKELDEDIIPEVYYLLEAIKRAVKDQPGLREYFGKIQEFFI